MKGPKPIMIWMIEICHKNCKNIVIIVLLILFDYIYSIRIKDIGEQFEENWQNNNNLLTSVKYECVTKYITNSGQDLIFFVQLCYLLPSINAYIKTILFSVLHFEKCKAFFNKTLLSIYQKKPKFSNVNLTQAAVQENCQNRIE